MCHEVAQCDVLGDHRDREAEYVPVVHDLLYVASSPCHAAGVVVCCCGVASANGAIKLKRNEIIRRVRVTAPPPEQDMSSPHCGMAGRICIDARGRAVRTARELPDGVAPPSTERPLSCDLTQVAADRSWPIPAGSPMLVRKPAS